MKPVLLLSVALGLCLLALVPSTGAQSSAPSPKPAATPEPTMSFEEYEPKSTLVVPEHIDTREKYPFVDVHNHQNPVEMPAEQTAQLVKDMDGLNMAVMNNLSGGSGEEFQKGWAHLGGRYPKRFTQFANVDFSKISEPDFGRKAAAQLADDVKHGAAGRLYGLDLPDEVLRKIYYRNALRLLPGIDKSAFPG